MVLVDRDLELLRAVHKWRFLLERHIKELVEFPTDSICHRRLRKLIEDGFLERRRILYGLPSLYTLTARSRTLGGASNYAPKIRIDQIKHDVKALDLMITLAGKQGIPYKEVLSPRDINSKGGFGGSKHAPDFVIGEVAYELELSLKMKERLFKNIQSNFQQYKLQVWIVDRDNPKLISYLREAEKRYFLEIVYLDDLEATK